MTSATAATKVERVRMEENIVRMREKKMRWICAEARREMKAVEGLSCTQLAL